MFTAFYKSGLWQGFWMGWAAFGLFNAIFDVIQYNSLFFWIMLGVWIILLALNIWLAVRAKRLMVQGDKDFAELMGLDYERDIHDAYHTKGVYVNASEKKASGK